MELEDTDYLHADFVKSWLNEITKENPGLKAEYFEVDTANG